MEQRKKVKVKYYTDAKNYDVIEVYDDEVKAVKQANRIVWNEDHAQRRRRDYLKKKGIVDCSLESIDSDCVWIEDGMPNPEQKMIAEETIREEKERLYNAISKLTNRQQEFIRLIYFQGWSQDAVARKYGITKSSLSDAMRRIYASLKKLLTKN